MEISLAIQEVVQFARSIPGFNQLNQTDKILLLNKGSFEVNYRIVMHVLLYAILCNYNLLLNFFNPIKLFYIVFARALFNHLLLVQVLLVRLTSQYNGDSFQINDSKRIKKEELLGKGLFELFLFILSHFWGSIQTLGLPPD